MKASKKKASTVQKKTNLRVYMRRYWQLYVLLLLPMIYLIVFKYVPMVYIQIAFKKYSIVESVWTMPWADNHGFEYFIKAFKNRDFINALRNTLVLFRPLRICLTSFHGLLFMVWHYRFSLPVQDLSI